MIDGDFLIAVVAAGAWSGPIWPGAGCRSSRRSREGLEALGDGEKARLVLTESGWPIGRLVDTFNSAATEIQARTARLDQDRQELLVVVLGRWPRP